MNNKCLVLFKFTVMLTITSLTSACVSNVTVSGKIPAPLIERLPLQAKLVYSDEFQRYSYAEQEKGRGLRSIAFGEAQVSLFDTIFGGLLNLVNNDSIDQKTDLTITPTLLDFQYSAPRESRLNLYEIWLKYRLQINDDNNQQVADWVVKGYGKTPTAMLSSADDAFDSATNIALRDVGAQLAIGFTNQPLIESYLNTRLAAPSLRTTAQQRIQQITEPERNDLELIE